MRITKFLKAAFYFTQTELIVVFVLVLLKFAITVAGLQEASWVLFIIIGIVALALLVVSLGLGTLIESRGHRVSDYSVSESAAQRRMAILVRLVERAALVTLMFGVAYNFAPTSIVLFLYFLLGMVLANIIRSVAGKID